MRIIIRFFQLLRPALHDIWQEAKGNRCSQSCAEQHTYDRYCILHPNRLSNPLNVLGSVGSDDPSHW